MNESGVPQVFAFAHCNNVREISRYSFLNDQLRDVNFIVQSFKYPANTVWH
jgi:hypothetical protein